MARVQHLIGKPNGRVAVSKEQQRNCWTRPGLGGPGVVRAEQRTDSADCGDAAVSQNVVAGTTVSFNVGLVGTTPMSCQWQCNGTNLANGRQRERSDNHQSDFDRGSGGSGGDIYIGGEQFRGKGHQCRRLVGGAGCADDYLPAGESKHARGWHDHFCSASDGPSPLNYQWLFNGVNLVSGGNVSGATTTNLTLSNAHQAQAGVYSVVVSNSAGHVTSAPAQLIVSAPPVIMSPPAGQACPPVLQQRSPSMSQALRL